MPEKILKISKEQQKYAWPSRSKLNFYDGWKRLLLSTTDRMFDLSDGLMLNWNKQSRIIYLGISTKNQKIKFWDEENIEKIENLIRYDLNFDWYSVSIDRLSEGGRIPGSEEYLWKLRIRTNL
jgi:hypothetical protein